LMILFAHDQGKASKKLHMGTCRIEKHNKRQ
jgi:hypothetical protein